MSLVGCAGPRYGPSVTGPAQHHVGGAPSATRPRTPRALWTAMLACFVLAAATGAGLRFSWLHGLPWELSWANVRHAHAHLLFFSWATPALMLLTLAGLGRPGAGRAPAWTAIALGAGSYLPFLLSGYAPTPLFGRALPLSMIFSGLSGLAWILFAGLWMRTRAGEVRADARRATVDASTANGAGTPACGEGSAGVARHAIDLAVFVLLVSLVGALGLAAVGMSGSGSARWMPALVTFYLDLFGEGWFALALLGVAATDLRPVAHGHGRDLFGNGLNVRVLNVLALDVLALGLLVRALAALALHGSGAPDAAWAPWAEAARFVGGVTAGSGLAWSAGTLLAAAVRTPAGRLWLLPLAFLVAKGLFDVARAVPEVHAWTEAHGLRIVLLHAYLLGGITLGLLAAARRRWGLPGASRWTDAGVLVLLAGLVPMTGLWPVGWTGPWIMPLAAWTSLAPIVAIVGVVVGARPSAISHVPGCRKRS